MKFLIYKTLLKNRLLRLGGFTVKKQNLVIKNSILFNFFKQGYYLLINNNFSIFQLIVIFKFYSSLFLSNKNVLIASFIKKNIYININGKKNFFFFKNYMGGLFTNKIGISWSSIFFNPVYKIIPTVAFILDKNQNKILSEFILVGIPTIGFIDIDNFNSNKITFPLFINNNSFILYFIIRLFIRLLMVYKFRI